ncbi:hypothetical protein P152DRAFT_175480 [Eremomyces bilateralis CBS 781.70]|uniref:Molybdopterin synthase sulfur carrier subunit n=1 Tax=Eremomyces bilateralis CBS 781.70 TaxID=1392243 RepID=A0A6G1FTM7_9PEZI|nr:uncharacterized protein P152DRAFT_175480 [Eremomyces bilateralis CBS 781.70]KAF1809076.1 hypothetical protein P152DRAFT_175480 [Eremomyces bilateralis CBS 781.70]
MTSQTKPSGQFKILYFASATSFTNKSEEYLDAPLNSRELFDVLDQMYPGMKASVLDSSAVTRNLEYLDLEDDDPTIFQAGDEVAIIPPVSSG